jgi:hypothetical protein
MTRPTAVRILIALIVVWSAMLSTLQIANAAPSLDAIISDTHLGAIDDVWIATMDVHNDDGWTRIYVSMLNEYSTLPVEGHSEVLTQTADLIVFSQNNVQYAASIYVPARFDVMIAIKGQVGDDSYDNAMYDLANDCSVLVVIDNANDPLSPFIYTRLACNMTQQQIDNAPEYLGDSLLAITPLYVVNLPITQR